MGTLMLVRVVSTLVVGTMTCTANTRVKDETRQVATHNGIDVAHATSYNFDTM